MGEQLYQIRTIHSEVFRAYDIRGMVPEQLDENAFYTIGKAISERMKALERDKIVLARDGRLSSERLSQALKQGLLDSGIDVLDLGMITTPMMYFATHESGTDCGLMVTGSHNPKDYNGIKMVLAGKTLVESDIQILYESVQKPESLFGKGVYESLNILEEYTRRIVEDITLKRPLKVVVDCGNGIAGPFVPSILRQIGCEVIELYCDVDGRFPNHHPDPSVEENLADLKAAVRDYQADIGLAFDGDADRLGIITNELEIIWPDRLMMLYVREILSRVPNAVIVYDVKCSSHLKQVIEEEGGVARMCPTGHSIVKGVMKQENAALAGEMSGHLFFKDRWFGFDDALYSACRLLEILSANTNTSHEQFASIPNSINTPEIKINIPDANKFAFMERFIAEANFLEAELITIDGLRVEFPYGWGLLRASNTTPCLVARFEAEDMASLQNIQAQFREQLINLDKNLAIPF